MDSTSDTTNGTKQRASKIGRLESMLLMYHPMKKPNKPMNRRPKPAKIIN